MRGHSDKLAALFLPDHADLPIVSDATVEGNPIFDRAAQAVSETIPCMLMPRQPVSECPFKNATNCNCRNAVRAVLGVLRGMER
jgi:hypothetical protein